MLSQSRIVLDPRQWYVGHLELLLCSLYTALLFLQLSLQ